MRFRNNIANSALERYKKSLQRAGIPEDSIDFSSSDSIPTSIFQDREIAVLEAIVEFLKEEKNLHYSEIANLLSRDDRTIWTTYSRVKKTRKAARKKQYSGITVPIKIFSDRNISAMEALCSYLFSEHDLSYSQIATLLNRDQRTVWTCVNRAKRKNARN